MKNPFNVTFGRTSYRKNAKDRYAFLTEGFHGDAFLRELVFDCLSKSEQFVETGSNVGSTLTDVSNSFKFLNIVACEPDEKAFHLSLENIGKNKNVTLYHEKSPDFLQNSRERDEKFVDRDTVFWLDAHGYGYEWPLKGEVEFITTYFHKGYVFIDDFKVPNLNIFGWDRYGEQECSIEHIRSSIKLEDDQYSLYYPNYTEKTSLHHPLRGWCLIEYGHKDKFRIPKQLVKKVRLSR